jgi:hypothetical protein
MQIALAAFSALLCPIFAPYSGPIVFISLSNSKAHLNVQNCLNDADIMLFEESSSDAERGRCDPKQLW